jgi:hypothetical protein
MPQALPLVNLGCLSIQRFAKKKIMKSGDASKTPMYAEWGGSRLHAMHEILASQRWR